MNTYAIICTRSSDLSERAEFLVNQLRSFGVDVKLLVGQSSIFEAYEKGLEACNAADEDIVIFCHDDVEFICTKEEFNAKLGILRLDGTGILGVAGTSKLRNSGIWWERDTKVHLANCLKGIVMHRVNGKVHESNFGHPGQAVAMDGLFLASTKKVWSEVGMAKPKYFKGNWDFYDIYYTTKAHSLGYKNIVVNLGVIHDSLGNMRAEWHLNREAFVKNNKLPIKI